MQLAIVGLGFMGATHVKAALTIPDLELAVVSRDPEKLKGDLSKVSGNLLMAAQVLRFFPAYDSLKTYLATNPVVRSATFRRRCAAPGWGPWLKDKAQSGGGVFDLLIHDIDMALYLFGAPTHVEATGY